MEKNFKVKFTREFEITVLARDIAGAQFIAQNTVAQYPKDTVKVLSIYAEDYVAPPEAEAKPIVQLSEEARKALVRQELKKPRWPGGIDDLWPA